MTAPRKAGQLAWAHWLQAQLDERDWDQSALARESKGTVTSPQVSRWLSGQNRPGISSIRAVCATLGVPPVEGMVVAGHLDAADLQGAHTVNVVRRLDPGSLTKRELLAELDRRLPPDDTAEQGNVIMLNDAERGARWAAFEPDERHE